MWKYVMMIGMTAALASCQEGAAPADVTPMSAAERAACHADYGEVETGLFGNEVCVRPTTDGGNSCTTSASCEGLCLATDDMSETNGICSEDSIVFGCIDVFEDGEIAVLCID